MKLVGALLFCLIAITAPSQVEPVESDSTNLPSYSLRVIASVKSADEDHAVIGVENIVSYSSGATAAPEEGEEITVRLPGRNRLPIDARIEADIKESIEVGALPSGYILLDFRTIQ